MLYTVNNKQFNAAGHEFKCPASLDSTKPFQASCMRCKESVNLTVQFVAQFDTSNEIVVEAATDCKYTPGATDKMETLSGVTA